TARSHCPCSTTRAGNFNSSGEPCTPKPTAGGLLSRKQFLRERRRQIFIRTVRQEWRPGGKRKVFQFLLEHAAAHHTNSLCRNRKRCASPRRCASQSLTSLFLSACAE